jgi:hypothetical protein
MMAWWADRCHEMKCGGAAIPFGQYDEHKPRTASVTEMKRFIFGDVRLGDRLVNRARDLRGGSWVARPMICTISVKLDL